MTNEMNRTGTRNSHPLQEPMSQDEWLDMNEMEDFEDFGFEEDFDFDPYSGESGFDRNDKVRKDSKTLFNRPAGRPDARKADEDLKDIFDEIEDFPENVEDTKKAEEEKKETLATFKKDVEEAKGEYKKSVDSNEKLDPTDRENLVRTFNEKADALAKREDVEKAREELVDLVKEMDGQIETGVDAAAKRKTQEREGLYQDMMRVTSEPKFKEDNGHWRQMGWQAGEMFRSSLQGGSWSSFTSFLPTLQGDQKFVVVMRLVSAIYRTAGRDEAKAIKMINHLVPKEAVQSMIDSVTADAKNLDWKGQGWPDNGDQVGPDRWHEWTPRGTADFLRRSLEARRESDPYTAQKDL